MKIVVGLELLDYRQITTITDTEGSLKCAFPHFYQFYAFCRGKEATPSKFMRFKYDPFCGMRIDWDAIYESYKKSYSDFDEELDKKFYE